MILPMTGKSWKNSKQASVSKGSQWTFKASTDDILKKFRVVYATAFDQESVEFIIHTYNVLTSTPYEWSQSVKWPSWKHYPVNTN